MYDKRGYIVYIIYIYSVKNLITTDFLGGSSFVIGSVTKL